MRHAVFLLDRVDVRALIINAQILDRLNRPQWRNNRLQFSQLMIDPRRQPGTHIVIVGFAGYDAVNEATEDRHTSRV